MSNTKHVVDNISAYLDGRLSAGDRAQVEAHLGACPSCQAELDSLQYVVAMTRSLPDMRAPRSFTLSPEMAERARPRWQFGWIYTSLRGFTALAAVLLVLVCSADFLALNRSAGFGAAAPAPAAMSVPNGSQTASVATDQVQNQPKSSTTVAVSEAPVGAAASVPSPVLPVGVTTPAAAPAQAAQASPTRAAQAPRTADGATSTPGTTARSAVASPSASGSGTPNGSPPPAPAPSLAPTVTVTLFPTVPAAAGPPPAAGFMETSSFRVAELWLLGALTLGMIATLVLRAARR